MVKMWDLRLEILKNKETFCCLYPLFSHIAGSRTGICDRKLVRPRLDLQSNVSLLTQDLPCDMQILICDMPPQEIPTMGRSPI